MGLFRKKDKSEGFSAVLYHVTGLPLAENTSCKLHVISDVLTITNGSSVFTLNLSQLSAVDFKMDVEITQIVKSSAVKGVAGAALFGPVGAVIGSMPNSKEKRTVTGYLIINYTNSNGELAALLFSDDPSSREAAKFVDKLRPLISNNTKQSYQL